MFDIPESVLRSNAPVFLYELNGIAIETPLLPANKAETWAARAREVDSLTDQIAWFDACYTRTVIARNNERNEARANELNETVCGTLAKCRSVQEDRRLRMHAALAEYSAAVFTPEVIANSTEIQLAGAFYKLMQYTDPFLVTSTLQMEVIRALNERAQLNTGAKTSRL